MDRLDRDQVITDGWRTLAWLRTLEGTTHEREAKRAYISVEHLLELLDPDSVRD